MSTREIVRRGDCAFALIVAVVATLANSSMPPVRYSATLGQQSDGFKIELDLRLHTDKAFEVRLPAGTYKRLVLRRVTKPNPRVFQAGATVTAELASDEAVLVLEAGDPRLRGAPAFIELLGQDTTQDPEASRGALAGRYVLTVTRADGKEATAAFELIGKRSW